jgi:enamine deaminase RidA (YjgF/YER057c/UK114 family)
MLLEGRLEELGFHLPPIKKTVGKYSPILIKKQENVLFLSGQLPIKSDGEIIIGKLMDKNNIAVGQEAARQATLVGLAQIKAQLGRLDYIKNVLQIVGYVNSAPDFTDQHLVMDGATELIVRMLPDEPYPTRIAVGVSALPLNAMIEISMLVNLKE